MALITTELDDLSALVAHLLHDTSGRLRWFRGQGCELRHLSTSLGRRLLAPGAPPVLEIEQRLITRFRQRSLPFWPEGYPQSNWEHLFAMQHYGVPTRLLDWTENALMAAFFAGDHDSSRCECGRADPCKPTLWVLHPVSFNENNPRLEGHDDISVLATSDDVISSWAPGVLPTTLAPWPVALYGTHNSNRIVAQQGTFTVTGKQPEPLDQSAPVINHDGVLEKIVLTESHTDLKRRLRTLGLTHSAVYPDLPALSADITELEFS